MPLRIRLARAGAKKRPFYRIVVAESRSPRDGRFIEKLGTYNPMLPKEHGGRVVLKTERVKHWLAAGATPSERVARFLGQSDLAAAPPVREQTKQHLPRPKTLERRKAAEAAAKAKAEAAAQAAAQAAAPAEEETPAEAEAQPAAPAEQDAPAEAEAPPAAPAEEEASAEPEAPAEGGEEKAEA